MRRLRKQPIGPRNDRNMDLEAGDRVYSWVNYKSTATMDDLRESTGWGKRNLGELTPRKVTKNGATRVAVLKKGVWYWP